MDDDQVALAHHGIQDIASLCFARGADGKIVAVGPEIPVATGEGKTKIVTLPSTRALFSGTARPPDLSAGPTPDLEPFFMMLEATVVRFCEVDGRDMTDQEMLEIYAELRRRPDGKGGRLFTYLQAAARLYMSARPISQAEYDAVMNRLAKSARTFSMPPLSRNYLVTLRDTFEP